jgi:hypothetical protein
MVASATSDESVSISAESKSTTSRMPNFADHAPRPSTNVRPVIVSTVR